MNIGVVLASGKGTRMGLNEPKQFLLLNDKPLYIYTLETFSSCEKIDYIVLVTNEEYIEKVKKDISFYSLNKVKYIIKGGNTRQESVFNALTKLKEEQVQNEDIVLIHDSARVLVSEEIINNNIEACILYEAVDTVVPCVDSMIISYDKKKIDALASRDQLFSSQTPQTFKFDVIYKSHLSSYSKEATDDCSLVLSNGHDVHLVTGSKLNFKVTTKEDLKLLKALIK